MKANQIRIPGIFNPGNQPEILIGNGVVRPKCFVLIENFVTFCDLLQAPEPFLVRS